MLGWTPLVCLLAYSAPSALQEAPFPTVRPATRAQAVTVLSGGGRSLPVPCLTPIIQSHRQRPTPPAVRRAMALLHRPVLLHGERRWVEPDGTILRYTTSRSAFDRIHPLDENRDGRPDLLEAAVAGMAEARELLVGQLGLDEPGPLEVLLVRIGGDLEGYLVPAAGRRSRAQLVLEASAGTHREGVRRAVIHQYTHAVALASGAGVPASWGEALATWAVMRLTGGPHAEIAELLSRRLSRLADGLMSEDLELAAGNAIWFAFVEEAYGPSAVRLAVQELAADARVTVALDRALRRSAGQTLASAFREFQVWALLVGDRSDGRHFTFAERLNPPVFATVAEGLPALSVQAETPIASFGGCQVLVRPDATEGGLQVHFEGEFSTPWEVDLLLVGDQGSLRRLPISLSQQGRGEATVPLDGLGEAILLVRNLGSDDRTARRYSWVADRERGYPFELTALEARWPAQGPKGVRIAWETSSEQHLLGFNILRTREDGATPIKVNPVWIPAVGDESETTSYQYLDLTAEPAVSYLYRLQAVTLDGLTSLSDPVVSETRPLLP